ncbi:unnamed protein product [Rhodiola kirilowii]
MTDGHAGGSSAAAPWIGVDGHAAEIYVSELRTLPRHHRFTFSVGTPSLQNFMEVFFDGLLN